MFAQEIDFFEFRKENPEIAEKIIFTGMIDEYFGYQLWSIGVSFCADLRQKFLDCENYQGNAVVNYTEREVPYTRVIEHKHFEFGNAGEDGYFQRVFIGMECGHGTILSGK